ncbi:MAG: acyltransferase [Candidatus Omnitrophota bacterium]
MVTPLKFNRRNKTRNYFVHKSAYIDEGAVIGNDTKIWHFSHIMSGARIGKKCKLGQNVYIGPNVKIGNNVKIQNNVSVYPGVTLEDDVFCGPSTVFTNIINPRSAINRNNEGFFLKTLIKKGASIGANVTIVCGHIIGEYAFIGAGATVTKDVLPYSLVYGNPARHKGWICECGEKLGFNGAKATCQECKKQYRKIKDKVKRIKKA